jgi:hypothetical protein
MTGKGHLSLMPDVFQEQSLRCKINFFCRVYFFARMPALGAGRKKEVILLRLHLQKMNGHLSFAVLACWQINGRS